MFHKIGLASRYAVGLSLISGSGLALQVTLTRIFSIMIWYHFTYLIIGVALLGGGAAGTYLAVRQWDSSTLERRLSKIAAAYGLSLLLTLLVINLFRFDPLSGKAGILATLVGLTAYFAALFTAFFLSGLAIAGIFTLASRNAQRLYFADLLGASIGTVSVVLIVQLFGGPGALLLLAALALVASWVLAGTLSSVRWRRGVAAGAVGLVVAAFMVGFVLPLQLPVPQSKELGWALQFTGASQPEYTRWNPVARVDVLPPTTIEEPMIVGGVSSQYWSEAAAQSPGYPLRLVTLDGTSMTGLYENNGDLSRFEFLKHAVIAAPYQLTVPHPHTLNIGIGGGLDILLARLYGASPITAIDLNSDIVELLKGPYAAYTGNLASADDITVETAEGRGFLMRGDTQYDLIQGIGLDNFAALSGGAYVLSESYLYTVDAIQQSLDRLTPNGIFSWTRDTNDPPREMLRLVGLTAEALRQKGVSDPASYIAIVANEAGTTATLLVGKQPLQNVQALRDWSAENGFPMLHDPETRLHTIYADYLYASDPRAFEAAYPFSIAPVTDDNPFFYNYFRWTNLTASVASEGYIATRLPVGNLILLLMTAFTVGAALLFILLPLLRYKRAGLKTPYAMPMLGYFSMLGLGYIFVEIVLIQRFTIFIGYPTHAIATTIFSLLLFSALGSRASQRLLTSPDALERLLAVLVLVLLVYIFALNRLLEMLLPLPDTVRIVVTIMLIAPLGFLMGMPFPTGLGRLGIQAQALVPWAWGMNGIFSVLGSTLVIIISMLSSFTAALVGATFFYAIAVGLARKLWRVRVVTGMPVATMKGALSET